MSGNILIAVSFVIVINCVTSIAKSSDEKVLKTSLNVTDHLRDEESLNPVLNNKIEEHEIFSEGSHTVANTSRSRGSRKGVNILDASMDPVVLNPPTNETSSNNINTSKVIVPSTSSSNVTISSSINNITVSTNQTTTVKLIVITTSSPPTSTMKLTTSTTTTTTAKPIRKPTITYSADDNAQILESEKNINYNVTASQQSEELAVPKMSSDTDRTLVDDEKSTRRSYVVFMGLAFALPMTFTLIHVMYKKVRNWMEIRHYQRVDFLVDGMYIS